MSEFREEQPEIHMRSFRKLTDHERPLLEAHLLRVGGEDRVMRFMAGVNDDYVRTHVSRIGWPHAVVTGCFVNGTLRGASELWFDTAMTGRCELALTVEHDFQGAGIGTELLRRSLVLARNRGAETAYLACLPQNRKMQHIVEKLGRTVTTSGRGMTESEIAISGPSQLSLWQEIAGDGIGVIDSLVERMGYPRAAA